MNYVYKFVYKQELLENGNCLGKDLKDLKQKLTTKVDFMTRSDIHRENFKNQNNGSVHRK
jgi:hypothetical protein